MLRKFNEIYFWPHWWCFGWFVILWSVIFWFLGVVLITYLLHHSQLIFWLKSLGIAIIWKLLNMICSFQDLVIFCLFLRCFAPSFVLFLSLVLTWSSFGRWFQWLCGDRGIQFDNIRRSQWFYAIKMGIHVNRNSLICAHIYQATLCKHLHMLDCMHLSIYPIYCVAFSVFSCTA